MRLPPRPVTLGAVSVDGVVVRRVEDRFRAPDGAELFRRAWLPPEPARVMVIVHGFGEHCGRYEEMAAWLARRGFAVHAYDQRGHGLTPGRRGCVESFDVFLDDLGAFLEFAQRSHFGKPLVLVGHSMGGLITSAFVCERQPVVDQVVLSGPALTLAPGVSRARLTMARAMSRVCPRFTLDAGLDENGLSRDPEVVKRYVEDPLVHGRVSAALGAGMMAAQLRTASSADRVHVPLLLLHGEEDPLCDVRGSRDFHAGLPHERVAGCALRTYPGLRHEIFNEPEREQVWSDLLGWLDAAPGRDPS